MEEDLLMPQTQQWQTGQQCMWENPRVQAAPDRAEEVKAKVWLVMLLAMVWKMKPPWLTKQHLTVWKATGKRM
jgi:hypothetical protein